MDIDAYDFHFMMGFRAANDAYDAEPEYFKDTVQDIRRQGLVDTWSEYSEYNFAEYLDIKMPEDEDLKNAVYEGIKVAMDAFFLKCYLKMKGAI